jgi:hypothetical protein
MHRQRRRLNTSVKRHRRLLRRRPHQKVQSRQFALLRLLCNFLRQRRRLG